MQVEIPSFIEIDEAYKGKNLAIVGVSMDISYEDLRNAQEGWERVRPFVRAHRIKYRILMGDDEVTRAYDIAALPATYLIDKSGRIAAAYLGIVDKDSVDANIEALLRER